MLKQQFEVNGHFFKKYVNVLLDCIHLVIWSTEIQRVHCCLSCCMPSATYDANPIVFLQTLSVCAILLQV